MWHFKSAFTWGRAKRSVMEVATFFCAPGTGFGEKVREYAGRLGREAVLGCEGVGVGKVVEVGVVPVGWLGISSRGRGGEEKSYSDVFLLMISWTDLDAHMKFRESELYRDMVGILQGFEEFEMVSLFSFFFFSVAGEWMWIWIWIWIWLIWRGF